MIEIGDLVEDVPPYRLSCGSRVYGRAVVVQVAPLVLISEDGAMLWWKTLQEGCVRTIGKATPEALTRATHRFIADKRRGITFE